MKSNTRHIGFRQASIAALALAAVLPWAIASAGSGGQSTKDYQPRRTTTDPPVPPVGKFGQDLFMAIDHRDAAAVNSLLGHGADPNSRNGLEMTPLQIAAASHQPDVMKALLAAKADANAETQYGTPLTFAAMTGHAEAARLLIPRGADVNYARVDGITVLMMAAQAGNPEFVAELLKKKVKVNETNNTDASPLSYAARAGHVEVGRMLLGAGAKVDQADVYKQTPLMVAATNGQTEFAKLLLGKGAKVNAKDAQGRTALHLAVAYGDNSDTVRALLAAGADAKAKDAKGRTAADLASKHGYAESANLLGKPVAVKARNADAAAEAAVKVIQKSMTSFNEKAQCISCHQEGLGRMATSAAKRKGMGFDEGLDKRIGGRIRGALTALRPLHEGALKSREVMKQMPLIEMNEITPGYSWMLAGMAARGEAPNQGSAAAAMVLAKQQAPNGSWTFSLPRVPMQSSFFTFTALSLKTLATYGPKAEAEEIAERTAKAKAWLLETPAKTSDDLAFRLLGLKWAGATLEERQTAIEEALAAQRPDGGWSQAPGMPSDAYATGQVLYALSTAGGIAPAEAAYAKGVQYLLRTQGDDGSWYVGKRAIPANNYFDADFPHGESQYASFNATCWATMALLETVEKR